jgi:hypothetical protein
MILSFHSETHIFILSSVLHLLHLTLPLKFPSLPSSSHSRLPIIPILSPSHSFLLFFLPYLPFNGMPLVSYLIQWTRVTQARPGRTGLGIGRQLSLLRGTNRLPSGNC